jgi:hypothetical protein
LDDGNIEAAAAYLESLKNLTFNPKAQLLYDKFLKKGEGELDAAIQALNQVKQGDKTQLYKMQNKLLSAHNHLHLMQSMKEKDAASQLQQKLEQYDYQAHIESIVDSMHQQGWHSSALIRRHTNMLVALSQQVDLPKELRALLSTSITNFDALSNTLRSVHEEVEIFNKLTKTGDVDKMAESLSKLEQMNANADQDKTLTADWKKHIKTQYESCKEQYRTLLEQKLEDIDGERKKLKMAAPKSDSNEVEMQEMSQFAAIEERETALRNQLSKL